MPEENATVHHLACNLFRSIRRDLIQLPGGIPESKKRAGLRRRDRKDDGRFFRFGEIESSCIESTDSMLKGELQYVGRKVAVRLDDGVCQV